MESKTSFTKQRIPLGNLSFPLKKQRISSRNLRFSLRNKGFLKEILDFSRQFSPGLPPEGHLFCGELWGKNSLRKLLILARTDANFRRVDLQHGDLSHMFASTELRESASKSNCFRQVPMRRTNVDGSHSGQVNAMLDSRRKYITM